MRPHAHDIQYNNFSGENIIKEQKQNPKPIARN